MNPSKLTPEQATWIAFLRTNPPKTTGRLEDYATNGVRSEKRCCLGHACNLFLDKAKIQLKSPLRVNSSVLFDNQAYELPTEICALLKITSIGLFNEIGVRMARIFLRENNFRRNDLIAFSDGISKALSSINDYVLNFTHSDMADLIELIYENNGFFSYAN